MKLLSREDAIKLGWSRISMKTLTSALFAACIVLPAAAAEVRPTLDLPDYVIDTAYHPWKGAYFLKSIHLSVKLNGCQGILWLWPGGRTKQICISSKPEPLDVWPTRIGLLYDYFVQRADNSFHRDTGLYLYADRRAKRLMTGRTLGIEVSPDGCKIAFQHPWMHYLPRPLPNRVLTVRVIDLCAHRARLQP